MKRLRLILFFIPLATSLAYAHDESKHKENAEAPKCEAMKNMDHSKMKSDDPVVQALMKKCMHDHDYKMKHDKKNYHNHKDNTGREYGHDEHMHENKKHRKKDHHDH